MNGSVDMMGALTGLGGSTYRNYAPYADAPEEGEFDWGGFARNLVMGLAVGAACIAMSLLLPGIGTIAAGALMGAGIGAVSASVAGAVGDYSSGNVRSTEEVIRDVAVSMVSGALTGAITGGLGAKLTSAFPKAAEAVGKIPLADWAKAGLFNTGDGILGRMVYAVADGNMSVEEKFAYAFSPEHMAMDFLGGAAMYGMSKVLPKIREKLPWNKISNESGSNSKNPMTGDDWHKYFNEKYGAENVTWESASIQDIIDMPSKITDFSPKQISDLARRSGWTVGPLGKGSLAGITYEQGGGISMHAPNGSSIYIQYHPGGGHHGVMPYYKVSSGKNGTVRYYINGERAQ